MVAYSKTNDIDVVILCGGLGTRLNSILKGKPKGMVEIDGCPFLDILIEFIASFGFRRFILCVGHKGGYIKSYYTDKKDSLKYVYSMEPKPLGTAGAIKNAEPFILSNPFMGFNGDSFCPANLKNLLDFHITNKLIASIVLTSKQEKGDYGSVQLNAKDEILNFYEKDQFKSSNHTNAGIYVFNDEIFQHIPSDKNSSLEYDIFPNLIKKGVSGFSTHQPFFDIGTPERLNFTKANLLKSINIQR